MSTINIRRIYDEPLKSEGYKVLVDRLWPRGISKEKAGVDIWLKEVGPSDELRKWFNHEAKKWPEFSKKYKEELKANPVFKELKEIVKEHSTVTLLYSAKDEEHNQAVVLRNLLKN